MLHLRLTNRFRDLNCVIQIRGILKDLRKAINSLITT